MLRDNADPARAADTIVDFLSSHDLHKAHGRHLHRNELRAQGLNILDLEDDGDLQDAVLSVHHACMLTVGNFGVGKLIENHNGVAHMKITAQIEAQQKMQRPSAPFPIPAPMPAPVPLPAAPPAPSVPQQPVPAALPPTVNAKPRMPILRRCSLVWGLLWRGTLPAANG